MADDLLDAVKVVIAEETGNAPEGISPTMTASDVPGWDSLAHARIMLEIAARLGITIEIEKTYRLATVADLVVFLRAEVRANAELGRA